MPPPPTLAFPPPNPHPPPKKHQRKWMNIHCPPSQLPTDSRGCFAGLHALENLAHEIKISYQQVQSPGQIFRGFASNIEILLGFQDVGDEIDVAPTKWWKSWGATIVCRHENWSVHAGIVLWSSGC